MKGPGKFFVFLPSPFFFYLFDLITQVIVEGSRLGNIAHAPLLKFCRGLSF